MHFVMVSYIMGHPVLVDISAVYVYQILFNVIFMFFIVFPYTTI